MKASVTRLSDGGHYARKPDKTWKSLIRLSTGGEK